MRIKLFTIFVISCLMLFGCSQEENAPISAPTQEESYIDGTWYDSVNEENKGIELTLNLDENFNVIGGNGIVDFYKSGENNPLNIEFTGAVTGTLVKSQISIIVNNPADSDYVSFNGGLDKNDSTKFLGTCFYYVSSENDFYSFQMILEKQ